MGKARFELSGQPVKDGLQVMLPANLVADMYTVTVPGIEKQSITLDVVPRLDQVQLEGNTVHVQGAGWGSAPTTALIEVNGQRLAAKGTSQTLTTVLSAPSTGTGTASDTYGVLNIRVLVGERASETKSLRKEAVTVRGEVRWPASGQEVRAQTLRTRIAQPSTRLLWSGPQAAPVLGLIEGADLGVLGLHQATYRSVLESQQAFEALERAGAQVEYDHVLQLQNLSRTFQSLGHLQAQDVDARQWQWPLLGVTEAWSRTRGAGVTVALLDTGVAAEHPDLQGRLWPGRDFVDDDASPQDLNGHGTHVAGLIAANGVLKGAAPEAKLLPVRVIGPSGGSVSDLIRGLLWAANLSPGDPNPHPAQVINLSLGTAEYSELLEQAIGQVLNAGILVVAATGNDGGLPYSPANIPGVLAVTSVSGAVTTYQPSYANRGPGTRLAAYGGDLNADQDGNSVRDGILSTDIDAAGHPTYALRQGTSMATPEVSGIAALLLAQGTPVWAVKALLEGQATDLGVTGMDLNTGWGLVNASATASTPDLYVVALDLQDRVITYVRPTNGAFTLQSLPPNTAVRLMAASDRNHNGVAGEAGELLSAPVDITTPTGQTGTAQLNLNPSSGSTPITLPR
jgi:subtilisin family serine protease